jgi:hypothetical protein
MVYGPSDYGRAYRIDPEYRDLGCRFYKKKGGAILKLCLEFSV